MKKLLYIQSLILLGGTVFSWSVLLGQFSNFYNLYGSLFRFKDCVIPNPMATPCFYGALAFLGAFIWSLLLIGQPNEKSQKYLKYFLLFGVVFALSVLSYEAVEYYEIFGKINAGISCAPGTPPLETPCFYGAIFFISAYGNALLIFRRMSKGII